jgi:hypothetical protein
VTIAQPDEHLAEPGLLDLEPAPARRLHGDRVTPFGRLADTHDPPVPRSGTREGARDRDVVGPVTDRPDDDEISRLAQLDTGDAPCEMQVGLHAVERRLVRRSDQNRVDIPVAGPRCGRQRMAGAGDRLAPEGEMAIVELELVQLRHALESAGRRSHQLGPHPVSGETGNSLDIHSVPPERVIVRFAQPIAGALLLSKSAYAASKGCVSEISP